MKDQVLTKPFVERDVLAAIFSDLFGEGTGQFGAKDSHKQIGPTPRMVEAMKQAEEGKTEEGDYRLSAEFLNKHRLELEEIFGHLHETWVSRADFLIAQRHAEARQLLCELFSGVSTSKLAAWKSGAGTHENFCVGIVGCTGEDGDRRLSLELPNWLTKRGKPSS